MFHITHGRRGTKRGEKEKKRHHIAPLNNKTQTTTYPLIPHREFPTVVTD
jgi:hypothetical protein